MKYSAAELTYYLRENSFCFFMITIFEQIFILGAGVGRGCF